MAQGDPTSVNLSGTSFLLNAETGVIIESEERDIACSFRNVFSASAGYDIGFVAYNWMASYSFSGLVNGTTGLAVIAPGFAMTTTNDLSASAATASPTYHGVAKTAGGIYVQSARLSHPGEELLSISGTALQRAGVP